MGKADGGLRPLFKSKMPGFWQAIETGMTGSGVPDSHFLIDGVAGWVEFKQTDTIRSVGLRPMQVSWINRYWRNGGRVAVAIRLKHEGGPRKGPPQDALYMYSGRVVIELNLKGLILPPDLMFKSIQDTDWDKITEFLTSLSPYR